MLIWLLAFAAVHLSGCPRRRVEVVVPPPFSSYRVPGLEELGIRRVVLLPVEHKPSESKAAERFRDALASELRATGLFEVVAPPTTEFGCWDPSNLTYGWVSASTLQELTFAYSADGVIFSSLRDYHPYSPPRIAATVHLVGTRNATTLASVDGVWDARNEDITKMAQEYAGQLTPTDEVGRPDIVLHTPAFFEKFVASQLAHAFASQWPQVTVEVARQRRLWRPDE